MTAFANIGALATAVLLTLPCSVALADRPDGAGANDSDWLIARKDGQWELVATGPRGRVRKVYLNQEVLRLGTDNSFVEVPSMSPVNAEGEVVCSPRARRDALNPCSSSFLTCRPDPANGALSMSLFVVGETRNAADRRNQLTCHVDVDAVLQAAKDVGMIRRILPRAESP